LKSPGLCVGNREARADRQGGELRRAIPCLLVLDALVFYAEKML
jgi:hypothetical protein